MTIQENCNKLKYQGHCIVLQEVPDEISLAFNISGCPVKCQDCHSKYLWEYKGNYVSDDIVGLLDFYKDMISCVCFMGGDQNLTELKDLCDLCKERELKTCLYTGHELYHDLFDFALANLNYLKVGAYHADKGGLSNFNTNQRMFKVKKNTLIDITHKFRRE